MKRAALLLAILLLCIVTAPACADLDESKSAVDMETVKDFLHELYTINACDLAFSDSVDSESRDMLYAAWLVGRLGPHCAPEVLDLLRTSRFPFRWMEEGCTAMVGSIVLEQRNPESAGEGRFTYTIDLLLFPASGAAESLTLTGRLTQSGETGLIADLRFDHL